MKNKIFKYLPFIIIPVLSILFCLIFELAQGEKVEEIVFGIILGIVFDLFYLLVLLLTKKKTEHNKTH